MKIIKVNLIILTLTILLFEIFFGFWFDKDNFGIYMRENRNINNIYKIKIYDEEKTIIYKRNKFGFRENQNVDPSKIKIIFLGGSTGNEKFKNYDDTIVGQLNKHLKNYKIYNASTDGKTLRGYTYDFKYWFNILKNFNPEVVIAYTGINDHRTKHPINHDQLYSENKFKQIRDYITNNSIIVYIIKQITWKLKAYTNYYDSRYNFNWSQNYKNFSYLDYQEALLIHNKDQLISENLEHVIEIKKRLNLFYNEIKKRKIKLIFVTQIYYDGLKLDEIFLINELIKEFSKVNNIDIIKLDELIVMQKYDFYDGAHTTVKGSQRIANVLAPELLKIISKSYN